MIKNKRGERNIKEANNCQAFLTLENRRVIYIGIKLLNLKGIFTLSLRRIP